MSADELNKVELPAIQQLQSLGWEYVSGDKLSADTSSERNSLKEVVLASRLSDSIKRLNPWISEENLRKVARDLVQLQTATLMEANQQVWETMVQLTSVEQDLRQRQEKSNCQHHRIRPTREQSISLRQPVQG